MSGNAIRCIASRELMRHVHNHWLIVVGALLLVVNAAVLRAGFSFSGADGPVDERALLLSMIHLQMYVVPLFAFVLAYGGVLSEREQGTLDLLLSYPLRYRDVIVGKWLGFSAVLCIAVAVGLAPLAVSSLGGQLASGQLLELAGLALLLGVSFVSLGLLVSSLLNDRTLVIATCIALWIFFVFVFDLGFVFVLVMSEGRVSDDAIQAMLMLNPAEAFRIAHHFGDYVSPAEIRQQRGAGERPFDVTDILEAAKRIKSARIPARVELRVNPADVYQVLSIESADRSYRCSTVRLDETIPAGALQHFPGGLESQRQSRAIEILEPLHLFLALAQGPGEGLVLRGGLFGSSIEPEVDQFAPDVQPQLLRLFFTFLPTGADHGEWLSAAERIEGRREGRLEALRA